MVVIAFILLIFIVVPICLNVCKEQVWDFVKEKLEKDAEHKKMVKEMLKQKK